MAFGEILTSLRKAKGLSQEQLAETLNIARQTISKWELNQSTPDMNYIAQLSAFFNVTTDYCFWDMFCYAPLGSNDR